MPKDSSMAAFFAEVWLVSFMDYDLAYIDLEEKTLEPLANPLGPKV
jgi:hypothetical protein